MEYVDVAWATSSTPPTDQIATSPTAKRLPSFINFASARRSAALGLRKKLMLRLVVTASGTTPIDDSTATYMAKSASAIMVGPDMVPPGRMKSSRYAWRTCAPPCQISSMERPLPALNTWGNSLRRKRSSSLCGSAGSRRLSGVCIASRQSSISNSPKNIVSERSGDYISQCQTVGGFSRRPVLALWRFLSAASGSQGNRCLPSGACPAQAGKAAGRVDGKAAGLHRANEGQMTKDEI